MPDSVEAWLLTTAINAHRDKQRRQQLHERRRDAIEALAQLSPWVRIALGDPEVQRGWKDELLRLLFACCHPVLQPGESAALALSTVIGLSVSEVAAAFVVAPRSMEQRLTRARQRLRELGDYDGTRPELAHDRLDAVLTALHLLFNEGYWSSSSEAPLRADLCRLAIGLAHSLLEAFPSEPEAAGLLALLLLHDARRAARLDPDGKAVPLPEQDRTLWDHDTIRRATDLLEHALGAQRPGPFQTEAAISAVHCRASSAQATEWTEIAGLYALLETFGPTPAVRVNRAFAAGRAHGPAAGLALLDDPALDVGAYPYADVVRGALLEEAGRFREAHACLLAAAQHTRNADEQAQLQARIQRVHARIEGGAAYES
jgi:RNA polymerase sigma-70 factor (ECF subfamily)